MLTLKLVLCSLDNILFQPLNYLDKTIQTTEFESHGIELLVRRGLVF
jgi:hypothetical protein